MRKGSSINFSFEWLLVAFILAVVAVMSFAITSIGTYAGFVVAVSPFVILGVIAIFKNPYWGFMATFIINYFIISIVRYSGFEGVSVLTDIFITLTLASVILNAFLLHRHHNNGFSIFNGLTVATLLWTLYCSLELLNSSAMTSAWFMSRGLVYYFPVIVIITFLVIQDFSKVKSLIVVLSVLTLIGAAKGVIQQKIGFDLAEQAALNAGMYRTHLLGTGTRYFSIYASAGIFGAVTGNAMVVFGIIALYTKSVPRKIYYIIVALIAFYGLMISGTRGALAVPGAGFLLFVLLSGRIRLMIPSAVALSMAYVFLAMTTIGQSNALIRRMRTIFDPNEPSLMVRLENQKLFGEYLRDKPFGEGLGLSGVDAQNITERFTTSIPTDSWYVKIWVETGIVGLILHIAILLYITIYGSFIVARLKNYELKGVMTGLLCGVFGIFVSSYGNQVLGQFPVAIIVYVSVALVFMGKYFDKQMQL